MKTTTTESKAALYAQQQKVTALRSSVYAARKGSAKRAALLPQLGAEIFALRRLENGGAL